MIAVSPSVNLTECRIRIKLELDGGSSYDTGLLFDYRPNPVIDDITPRRHLTSYVAVTRLNVKYFIEQVCAAEMAVRYAALCACRKVNT